MMLRPPKRGSTYIWFALAVLAFFMTPVALLLARAIEELSTDVPTGEKVKNIGVSSAAALAGCLMIYLYSSYGYCTLNN